MRILLLSAVLAASPAFAQTETIISGQGEYIGASQSRGKDKYIYGRQGPAGKPNNQKAIRDDFYYGGYGEPVGQVFTDQNGKD
jgi:hypothetical protein